MYIIVRYSYVNHPGFRLVFACYFFEKYIPNYHINLFNALKEKEFSKFITDSQIVFDMLQYKIIKRN